LAFELSNQYGQRPGGGISRRRTVQVSLPIWDPRPGLIIVFSLLVLLFPLHVCGQQGGVILDSNEPLFTILVARTAAGADPGSTSEAGSAARHEVSAYLARKKPAVSAELQKFFAAHQAEPGSGGNLSRYVSLALLMGPPPDFKLSVPQADLPPDAKSLAGLVPLLKTFAEQANVTDLWAQMQTSNQREIDDYSPAVRRSIEVVDAYLRFPSGAYLGRTYTIYLSSLGTPEQVHARIYGANYYLVVTPSKEPKIAEIRHQYLHFLLDPMAVKYGAEIQQKAEIQSLVRSAPQLGTDFKEDYSLFVTECLIRAVELRLDKRPAKDAEKDLEAMVTGGLVLTPYFYSALQDYEKQDVSMRMAYKDLVQKINTAKEREKIAQVKFAPKPEATVSGQAPALSQEELLLNQGENLIAEGKYFEARAAFKTVLETINAKSERALYGSAVALSNMRKPGLAEDFFKQTVEAAQDVLIVTWSHIYLGRLYDLKGERTPALEQYRAASLTAASYPDALRAVQDGMQRPFGFHK